MEKQLRDEFNIPAKHSTEQQLGLWRNLVMPVKNHRRRFRYVANLEKRMEAKEQLAEFRAKLQANFMLYMEALEPIDDMPPGKAEQILHDNTETRFQTEALTAVPGI